MSYPLTEEQRLIGQSASEFAKESLDTIAVDLDRTGNFPKAEIEALAGYDFLGLLLTAEAGGAEAGFISYVTVVEIIARSCPAVASIVNNHVLAAYAIQKWGSKEQKQQYLPAFAKGELLGTVAACESGPAGIPNPGTLVATRQGDGFVLKGTKNFVKSAGEAGVYVVFATTDLTTKPIGITAFIVDARTPGLKVGAKQDTMGLRGCPVADLDFDNVFVPESTVLGLANEGAAIVGETLAVASVAEAAQTVGIVQAALEHAAAYSKQRIQFGKPIGSFQAIQSLLANVAANCYAARLAVFDAAAAIEQGEPFLAEAAMVKLLAIHLGQKSLIDVIQVEGGYGYSEEMPLARLYRDVAGTTVRDSPADFPEGLIATEIA
jgi:butyryl-CoA dehydrogenase